MTDQTYYSPKQFCEEQGAFKIGGIRSLIFHEHENGLAQSGAIIRIGGKVLINKAKFFAWIEAQNQAASTIAGNPELNIDVALIPATQHSAEGGNPPSNAIGSEYELAGIPVTKNHLIEGGVS